MTTRQREWPRQWLMTDERLGDRLWEAMDRLPAGQSGIVFRHYATGPSKRADLAAEVANVCRKRGLMLAVAGDETLAKALDADLLHNPPHPTRLAFSQAVHSVEEAAAARTAGAALVFVSPVFATRSHPGQEALGIDLASRIARATGAPAIALGGMNAEKFALLQREGLHGWAGIDAWIEGPSRE